MTGMEDQYGGGEMMGLPAVRPGDFGSLNWLSGYCEMIDNIFSDLLVLTAHWKESKRASICSTLKAAGWQ